MSLHRCVLLILPVAALAQTPAVETVRGDYINALGGPQAWQGMSSRITEGRFDNGRGLRAAFRLYEKAPNKRLTTIGGELVTSPQGSGRGYDGATGWDRNFIGTGLRTLQGRELGDLAREADFFAALHLFDACSTTSVDLPSDREKRVLCRLADGRNEHYTFAGSGLLSRKDIALPDGGSVSVRFDEYRRVDAILLPFRTSVVLPDGIVVTYSAEQIRHNVPIDDALFARPAR